MARSPKHSEETFKPVKTVLISQPRPERSPYFELEEKYGIKIDWRPFIHVEGVTEREFRRQRVNPLDYTAIIFTSKNAIEHFFRLCEATRITMPDDMRYFCTTKAVADYLQKFIVYRKRKVFYGNRSLEDIDRYFTKFKNEKFLLPCSNLRAVKVTSYLKKKGIDFTEVEMYRTVASDLSDLKDVKYDVLVFFSPLGIVSLFKNFPDFQQDDTRIAVWGDLTAKEAEKHKLHINIKAPTPEAPSMITALENYLRKSNA